MSHLPVEAQFNVQADRLARSHIQETQQYDESPLLPVGRCQLHINEHWSHGNYIQKIRHAASVPDLKDYMRNKHRWKLHTTQDIDWQILQEAVSRYKEKSVNIVKLLHDQLPTRALQAKRDKMQSPRCPHCQHVETLDH